MTEYICPDCHCRFLSAFRCVTCGAQKLYDHTLALAMTEAARLRAEVERLTGEVASLRAAGLAMEANRDRCVAILEGLISAAWDAGAAHAIGSHRNFSQTHPSKSEWLKANGVGRSDE